MNNPQPVQNAPEEIQQIVANDDDQEYDQMVEVDNIVALATETNVLDEVDDLSPQEEFELCLKAANEGDPEAQFCIGLEYCDDRNLPGSVENDLVKALMWLTLSDMHGNNEALDEEHKLVEKLSPDEISKAHEMVDEWLDEFNNRPLEDDDDHEQDDIVEMNLGSDLGDDDWEFINYHTIILAEKIFNLKVKATSFDYDVSFKANIVLTGKYSDAHAFASYLQLMREADFETSLA